MLGYIILGILYDGSYTGYELKRMIEEGVGVFYKASFGSLYPAARKLAEKKFVTIHQTYQGERVKKIYSITDAGRSAFLEWLEKPIDIADNNSAQLSRIYFFDKLPEPKRLTLLQEYEKNSQRYLDHLYKLENKFIKQPGISAHYYKMSTLYYGICIMKETIRWCGHLQSGRPFKDL